MTDQKSATTANVLDSRDDPFAPREGKTLTWRNINMTLVSPRHQASATAGHTCLCVCVCVVDSILSMTP